MRLFPLLQIPASLCLVLNLGLFAASEESVGFWRIEQEDATGTLSKENLNSLPSCPLKCEEGGSEGMSEPPNPVFFLWISSSGRLRFFDSEWKEAELASSSQVEGHELRLSQYFRGGQLIWSGNLDQDSLSGEWRLEHPQFQMKGGFSGSRLTHASRANWSPLKAARGSMSPEGVLNLSRILHENAETSDFDDYWKNTFLPDYLSFLPGVPAIREGRTAAASSQMYEAAARLEALNKSFGEHLHRSYPGYHDLYQVVISPFTSKLDRRVVSEQPFLLINPVEFSAGGEGEVETARRLLQAQLFPYTRYYSAETASVFKSGLETFLLARAYPDQLPQVFGVGEKRLQELEKNLSNLLERLRAGKRLKPEETVYVGFDFIQLLASKYQFQQIVKTRPQEMVKRLLEYLNPDQHQATTGASERKRSGSR